MNAVSATGATSNHWKRTTGSTPARKDGDDGRPVGPEDEKCKGRNVVERHFGNDSGADVFTT
ncbi:hypothetical protein EP51_26095 [Rhodococcus opacus]|uniref:Uncharacterized protein n=1 Tax=Rhodococcus opacus TaxID=37919 RepID=A0A076ERU5_RHOOP|nr:hypothetical protein EP51_26095 [Rhodococcus opacus]